MPMGYMGYCTLGDSDYLLLCNSTGLEVQVAPIYSEAAIGQGWKNAALTTHYAENALTYTGGIDFELEWGLTLMTLLEAWIYSERAYSKKVIISPNGINIFTYSPGGGYPGKASDAKAGVWINTAGFNAGEGAAVTCSLDCMALERVHSAGATDYITNDTPGQGGTPSYPLNPSDNNRAPVPFWQTLASLEAGGTKIGGTNAEATTWNFDWANNAILLYTCSGVQGAGAVLMGAIDVTGGVTIYSPTGIDDTFLSYSAADTAFTVDVVSTTNAFNAAHVQVEGSTHGVGGKNEPSTRAFTWKAIGDGTNAPATFTIPTDEPDA